MEYQNNQPILAKIKLSLYKVFISSKYIYILLKKNPTNSKISPYNNYLILNLILVKSFN